jgi:hypothetical protein
VLEKSRGVSVPFRHPVVTIVLMRGPQADFLTT